MTSSTWNGPICPTCNKGYLGQHLCSPDDLRKRAAFLLELADGEDLNDLHQYRTNGCPCRPENGGSGICGCILGGPQITCGLTP